MQQHQAGIVFVVAGIEGTHHRHLLHARHHTGRRDLTAGRHESDLVTLLHTELASEVAPPHDPGPPPGGGPSSSGPSPSRAGPSPPTMAPFMSSPRASRACVPMKGAAPM